MKTKKIPGKIFLRSGMRVSLLLGILFLAKPSQGAESWQVKWDRTLKAAENEGAITAYVAAGDWTFLDAFQKAYPKIKLKKRVAARGSMLLNRIMAERRAGKYLADVYMTGKSTHWSLYDAKALDPIHPAFILPEVKDESNWFRGRHSWDDPEGRFSFTYEGYRSTWLYYNTNIVSSEEVSKFKSWRDILNSKWKGKIAAYSPLIPGPGGRITRFFYVHRLLGPEFMKKFYGGMKVIFSTNSRLLADWLAVGKIAWCIPCPAAREAREQGLPVNWVTHSLKEGDSLQGGIGTVSLVNHSPHPNARRIFINWLLSRKGQIAFQERSLKAGRPTNSLRMDIPKGKVPPELIPKKGVPLWLETRFEMEPAQKRARKLIREILATR